jgi:Ser/Thr protein kinase RdoA (MazF antagonist)
MNNHPFPIDKSLLSAPALSRVIEAEYGLADVRCRLFTATLRDVYLVSSNEGRYVGYVYRHEHRPTDEIRAEWQFVDYLSANGVPVAPAVRRCNGELLLAFHAPEGVRYGVLTRFAPGKHLRQRPGAAAVKAYGRIVAQIHVLADLMPKALKRPPIDVEDLLRRSIAAFAAEVPERPGELAFMQESAATLLPRIEVLPREQPYYGLVHGDVIRANAQVGEGGSVTILDFDLCGYCWRAYDVASYLAVIRGLPGEKESEQAFLSGYQQVRPLEEAETETLPLFEAVRTIVSIGIPAMNVYHWGSAYLHNFLDDDLDRLRHMMGVIG